MSEFDNKVSFRKRNVSEQDLRRWANNGTNVLLRGLHGTGKTARILNVFDKMGWVKDVDYLYYSAATMDPWTDLVGIPKERVTTVEDENGNPQEITHLGFIRPLPIELGQVKAIMVDEFNRAPKKVRNALMELIQFKSINGHKFPNLECIWAAVNPEDDENDQYDVEPIDPAQLDRFQIIVEMPYECSLAYFQSQYGRDAAAKAIEWWNALNPEAKRSVSPRRLDYALEEFFRGGDLELILPANISVSELVGKLSNGPVFEKLREFVKKNDTEAAKAFLADENHFRAAYRMLVDRKSKGKAYQEFFLPLIPEEKLVMMINTESSIRTHVFKNPQKFTETLMTMLKTADKEHRKPIENALKKCNKGQYLKGQDMVRNEDAVTFGHDVEKDICAIIKEAVADWPIDGNSYNRNKVYETIRTNMPRDLSVEQATVTLKTLDMIVAKAKAGTIKAQMTDMLGMVNTCVFVLHENNQPFDVIAHNFSAAFNWAYGQDGFIFKAEKVDD